MTNREAEINIALRAIADAIREIHDGGQPKIEIVRKIEDAVAVIESMSE
jgi:hypothetical protein